MALFYLFLLGLATLTLMVAFVLACDRVLKESVMFMLYLTGLVTLLLFVYLVVALLRPEWF